MREDLRPALYARVSSEQQAGSNTIASQLAALEARIAADQMTVLPEHRFVDDGYSGATLIRPALERLRDLAASGALDRVYVHSPDRLARRYAYQVLLVDELRRAGVEIVFLNRQIGTSPEDDLLLQVQGMVAEYERAKILERSRRGKRHAARRGLLNVLAGAPYGYRYLGKHDGGGVARYEIIEEQARVVRQVFEWVGRERASIGEVCRRLRQQGSPTSRGKPVWDRTTVWAMLRNPAYKGEAAFGKTRVEPRPARLRPVRGGSEQPRRAYGLYDAPAEDWITIPVPRLVDPVLFDAVREQLAENRRRSRQSGRGARYLLQGLLVCRLCGYAYYGKAISLRAAKGKRRDYAYYRCCGSDAYRFGGQRICSNPQLRTDRLDEAVWREVERLLRDPGRIATEYTRRLDEARRRGTDGADLATAEAQLAKLRRGMGRLIDGYADGLLERAEFEPRLIGFRQRIEGWDKQIQAMRDEAALQATLSLVIGRLEDFAQRVRERMSKVDWHMQRELIRLLVKRVEIDHDDVNVVFRIDSALLMPDPTNPQRDRFWPDCGRGDDSPLRRALRGTEGASLAAAHAPPTIRVRLLDRCLEPQFDEAQDMTINDPRRDRAKELKMRNRIEILR
jgi:site-specific DNA recombinase